MGRDAQTRGYACVPLAGGVGFVARHHPTGLILTQEMFSAKVGYTASLAASAGSDSGWLRGYSVLK